MQPSKIVVRESLISWIERIRNSPFVLALEVAGRFSIVIGLVAYVGEYPARVKQREAQAWQVINSSHGGASTMEAVEFLYSRGRILAQVNLEDAFLHGINLSKADLRGADFWKATLTSADLRGTWLENAYLNAANLDNANLSGANLRNANLTSAILDWSRLDGADLTHVSGLSQEQLDHACATTNITLTDSYKPPKADCSQIPGWK